MRTASPSFRCDLRKPENDSRQQGHKHAKPKRALNRAWTIRGQLGVNGHIGHSFADIVSIQRGISEAEADEKEEYPDASIGQTCLDPRHGVFNFFTIRQYNSTASSRSLFLTDSPSVCAT